MGRLQRVFAFVMVAGIALGARQTARAQQTPAPPGLSRDILATYLPPPGSLPSGLQTEKTIQLSNVTSAGLAQDPAEANKIILRSRLDGVIATYARTGAPTIVLWLSLYGDANGAQMDLRDPVELAGLQQGAGVPLAVSASPPFADASVAYTLKTATSELAGIGFVAGRLEALVTESGPSAMVTRDDLLPLVMVVAAQAQTPPPPASAGELAVVQRQTDPESILHDAYTLLLGLYVTRLTPDAVLGTAYDGAVAALDKADSSDLPPRPQITAQRTEEGWAQFLDTYKELESRAGSLSLRDLAYAAADGMYSHLNCHTEFFTPARYARELATLHGEAVAGTGLAFARTSQDQIVVLRVLPNSPAEAAGIAPGDEITAVNQQTFAQLASGSSSALTGEVGKSVTLTVSRPGAGPPVDVHLTLAPVQRIVEEHHLLPGGVGYIEFDGFPSGDTVVDRVRNALLDFEATGGVNGWVLDLRYNIGGSAATMSRIAGLFVPTGSTLLTVSSQGGDPTVVRSVGTPLEQQRPLAILTSASTASMAEIFAQSLRDLGRATVVGGKTAGCVNGGQVFALLDGSGVFVSTGDARSGPNRVALENVGVVPDNAVTFTRDDLVNRKDPRLDAAVALLTPVPATTPTEAAPVR